MHNFSTGYRQAIALSLLFFISALCFIQQHEMWRDELQAWLLARDSATLIALFKNLKYEYHQSLWYLLLFPLTRIFDMPEAMQYLNLSIATAAVFLIAKYSPFSLMQKILLAFSYFLFYEYAFIARNYALTVFFIFLLCALFPRRTKYPLLFASALFLLCHTSLMGLIFAIGISLTVLLETIMLRANEKLTQVFHWQIAVAALIVVTGIGTAIFQLAPPPDLFVWPWKFYPSLAGLKTIVTVVVGGYFPLPSFELHFWRTLFGLSTQFIGVISILSVICIVVIFVRFLASRPSALFLYIATSAALVLFFYSKHVGELRHHGFLFIALIAALWIHQDCAPAEKPFWVKYLKPVSEKIAARALLVLLIIQLMSSSIAVMIDYRYVFSSAKQTAQFLRSNHLDSSEMIGDVSYATSSVAAYLINKQFFYPDAQRYGTFIKWDNQRTKEVNLSTLLRDSQRLSMQDQKVVLILNQPIDEYKPGADVSDPKIYFEKIFESDRTILWDERFYVYLFKPTITAYK
jgi:hypothetical protein